MARRKPTITFLRGPSLLDTLRSVRLHVGPSVDPRAASAPNGVGPVRFGWDYTAFPLWWDGDVPGDFAAALQEWSDEGTEHFLATLQGEDLPEGWLHHWVEQGRSLAQAATQLVGDVEYENGETHAIELIGAQPRDDGFATPEEAALAGFGPGAEAHIVSVQWIDDRHARVIVDTVPSHPITSDVQRDLRGRWSEWSAG